MKRLFLGFFLGALMGVPFLAVGQEPPFEWQRLGAQRYTYCAGCHGTKMTGLAGAVPPHVGHLPNVAAADGGRRYLINVLLYGLKGEVTILGQPYDGVMPAWSQLSDEEIAAILNYELHAYGNDALLPEGFVPIMPSEVTAERGQDLDMDEVHALRQSLGLNGDE